MDKQKQLFSQFLTSIGYSSEDAETVAAGMFDEDNPSLDIPAIQMQAQSYAKPLIKDDIISENRDKLRAQYANEYEAKIIKASNGKLTRSSVEGIGFDEVLKKYTEIVSSAAKGDESEHEEMIKRLNEQLEAKDNEWQQKYSQLENSHKAERVQAENKQGLLKYLASKKLAGVDPEIASKAIQRELGEKFHIVYNSQKNDFDLYEKDNIEKKAKNGTGNDFAKGSEEIDNIIKAYGWEAKSNGGGGGNPNPKGNPNPNPNPGAGGKGKSLLGSYYEKQGQYEQQ